MIPSLQRRLAQAAVFVVCGLLGGAAQAEGPPPLEAYGDLPGISLVTLSPSGKRIAFRHRQGSDDFVAVRDLATGEILASVRIDEVKPRALGFVNEDKLLLVASDLMKHHRVRGKFEYSGAFVLDVQDGTFRRLLYKAEELFPYQGGIGRVIGANRAGDRLYMPAFVGGPRSKPAYSLFEVELDRRRERIIAEGNPNTIDWIVDGDGRPYVRVDFDNANDLHRIYALGDKDPRLVYEERTNRPDINVIGLTPDRRKLVYQMEADEEDVDAYYTMDLASGEQLGPVLGGEGLSVEQVYQRDNRVVYGVAFAGFLPSYQFFDDALSTRLQQIQVALQGTSVTLVSWSSAFKDLLIYVSGGWNSGAYLLFRDGQSQPQLIANSRPQIESRDVARTLIDEYEARDGLMIPALITARQQELDAGNAPLVMLPHGGPGAYDAFRFDWLAQYFASRGYVVMQPQFRGSTGFGLQFADAGNGEWGKKMQSDLDDGLHYLVDKGLVDPERVCIMGASYGGYAALAAGFFSPEKYRCHVSINGVSDLRVMLERARRSAGSDHWIVDYWEEWYGAERSETDAMDAISPAHHAESFRAPVLLVHGKDDTVVPADQSRRMNSALKRADKDVTMVLLSGEDHWLSRGTSRTETLRVVAEFIESHL